MRLTLERQQHRDYRVFLVFRGYWPLEVDRTYNYSDLQR